MTPSEHSTWQPIAVLIRAGKFDGADKSTKESLLIGIRGLGTPESREAMARLETEKPKRTRKAKA